MTLTAPTPNRTSTSPTPSGVALSPVRRAICDLMPVDVADVAAAVELADIAPNGFLRSLRHHVVARLGNDMPDELVSSITTLDDLDEWVATRWGGNVPDDLVDATASLRRPRLALRPVTSADVELIYYAATHPDNGFRWRFKGATPSPDEVMSTMWSSVLAQFIVHDAERLDPIGLVVAYQASLANGYAYVGLLRLSPNTPRGETMEGLFLLLEHTLRSWPLRKVYVEVPGYNLDTVIGGRQNLLTPEGRLRQHEFHDGRWWDFHTFSVTRQRWDAFAEPWRTWLGTDGPTSPAGKHPGVVR